MHASIVFAMTKTKSAHYLQNLRLTLQESFVQPFQFREDGLRSYKRVLLCTIAITSFGYFNIILMMEWLKRSIQRVKYEGKYNFHIVVSNQKVDSSSTISIMCFTDRQQRAVVPCNFLWFSIKNSLPQEVTQFRGSTFICDTTHVGFYIQAHIISTQIEYGGKAILTFGPVELDVSLKTDILNTLSQRSLFQSINLLCLQSGEADCELQLLQSQIKIKHSFSDINYVFDYSILEPHITLHPKETNKINIVFNEKYSTEVLLFQSKLFQRKYNNYEIQHKSSGKTSRVTSNENDLPKFQVCFLTRAARDLFLFSMKAFVTKRQMMNWAISRKIEDISFGKEEDFSILLQLQSLRNDLIRYDKVYKQSLADKKLLQDEMAIMQKDMENIKTAYNNLISNKHKELTSLNAMQLQRNSSQFNLIKNPIEKVSSPRAANQMDKHINVFSKKKQTDDCSSISHLLDNLNNSQICHFDLEKDNHLMDMQNEKRQLQQKLQRSLQHIEQLQKQLKNVPNVTVGSSLINFTYRSYDLQNNDQIKKENAQMKISIQNLLHQNSILRGQNKPTTYKLLSPTTNKLLSPTTHQLLSPTAHKLQSPTQNRNMDIGMKFKHEQQKFDKLNKQIDSLKSILIAKQTDIDTLRKQTRQLIKNRTLLQERVIQAQISRNELQMQLSMLKKNMDVLNRSQNISIQMDNFNDEQIKMLKQHNSFLVDQNEKLVRACEKYMAQAKQTNKLRQEILRLKEKLTNIMTNPQNSSYLSHAA